MFLVKSEGLRAVEPILLRRETHSTHGKHKQAKQRRTQEGQASRPEEAKSGKPLETSRVCTRFGEAQSEKAGSRHGEAIARGIWQLARSHSP
jgi:hypothetical protein